MGDRAYGIYVNIYLLETKKRYAQEKLHHIYLRISCS